MRGSQLEKSLILQILSLGWTTKLMILLPSNPKQPGNGGLRQAALLMSKCTSSAQISKAKRALYHIHVSALLSLSSCDAFKTGAFAEYLGLRK